MPVFTAISQEDFVADVHVLAAAIRADDWQPSFLIGIRRGGLIPAVYLSHATGWPMLSCDLSGRQREFGEAMLIRLATRTQAGDRLLFVDDINDSGRTIALLRAMLAEAGAAPDHVRFATLLDNIVSAERIDYAARAIDRTVTKDWYVFPWEAVASRVSIKDDAGEVPDRIA